MPIYKGDDARVRAGAFLWVEPEVELQVGGNHRIDWVTTFPLREIYDLPGAYVENPWSKGDIVIGNGVLLGHGSRLLSGVTIGDGALVARQSVVTRDVRSYTVAAGNPAREAGPRFSANVIAVLRHSSWWEGPDQIVRERLVRETNGEALALVRQLDEPPEMTDLPRSPVMRARRAIPKARAALSRRLGPYGAPRTAPSVTMGIGSYGRLLVEAPAEVRVGSYSSVAPGSAIVLEGLPTPPSLDGAHDLQLIADSEHRVDIGHDVWIGRGCRIMSGVTIGHGAVVGAYSVVTDNVPPYAVAVGNPAREVRRRFDGSTVDALLRIGWWDWPHEKVLARCEELCCSDLDGFINRYDPAAAR